MKSNFSNKNIIDIYNKQDIMKIFKCESDKALKILKIMYQMKEANKIGKEYYVDKETLVSFLDKYKGEEILIWIIFYSILILYIMFQLSLLLSLLKIGMLENGIK